MRLLFPAGAVALATLLVACAAEPTAPGAAAAPSANAASDEMVCTREYPIGSNIPINKCRTRAQAEAERSSSQETLRGGQTGGGGSPKPGG